MKLALAQIQCQPGELDQICERIFDQARIAFAKGADCLVTPAPLFQGILPGSLVTSPDYCDDVIAHLSLLAKKFNRLDMQAIIPMVVPFEGASLFECIYLKDGRVIPMRSTIAATSKKITADTWLPPVFEVADMRVAITFDAERDASKLPHGVDMLIAFQVDGYKEKSPFSAAIGGVVEEDDYISLARDNSLFLAYMAGCGAYDEACYTGGSFILDPRGYLIAQGACFEEDLVVQEITRDRNLEEISLAHLVRYNRQQWTWEALRAGLKSVLTAQNKQRVALVLNGDLPSSLLAALAVDTLGPRNVFGLLVENNNFLTPTQKAFELERREQATQVANHLHLNFVTHRAEDTYSAEQTSHLSESTDTPYMLDTQLTDSFTQMAIERVAALNQALVLSCLTKTDYALCGRDLPTASMGIYAPFGDLWLSTLKFLGAYYNRHAGTLPQSMVTMASLEKSVQPLLVKMYRAFAFDTSYAPAVAEALSKLNLDTLDEILEMHIEKEAGTFDIVAQGYPEQATVLLLRYIQMGEHIRRMLPPFPIVSENSFPERCWPASLSWSDRGRVFEQPRTFKELAQRGARRSSAKREEQGSVAMDEVKGVISDMLGLEPEQLDEMSRMAQDALKDLTPSDIEKMSDELKDVLKDGQIPPIEGLPAIPEELLNAAGKSNIMMPGSPFFSQN